MRHPSPGIFATAHRFENILIAKLLDSIDGYQKSAADSDNQALADKFNARARERQSAVTKLQAAVATAGGNPDDDGTVLAGAHRAFLNLKEVVTGKDDKAIVAEIERGEDYARASSKRPWPMPICPPPLLPLPTRHGNRSVRATMK